MLFTSWSINTVNEGAGITNISCVGEGVMEEEDLLMTVNVEAQ